DDGFILYLNGAEIFRLGMSVANPSFATFATRSVGTPAYEGPFILQVSNLVAGTNVIAAEVHQTAGNSADVGFAINLDAAIQVPILPLVETAPALRLIPWGPQFALSWEGEGIILESSPTLG